MYRLVIAQKAYSSWSFRGWLLLAAFDLPFREIFVPMYDPAFEAMKAARAPGQTVPMLEWDEDGGTRRIWDTMAIAETLAERHPEAGLWPADPWHRSVARTVASEMHSGFPALRGACPMNLHRESFPLASPDPAVERDVSRAGELWHWARQETGGPWLGGARFSAADVFFVPLATRLISYALLTPATEEYARQCLEHPAVREWVGAARADPQRIPRYDTVT